MVRPDEAHFTDHAKMCCCNTDPSETRRKAWLGARELALSWIFALNRIFSDLDSLLFMLPG